MLATRHSIGRNAIFVSAMFLVVGVWGPHRCAALDNGVGLTPAMGYNTWDDFRCNGINASNIKLAAEAMVRQGLSALGYRYLSVDDCWAKSRDPTTGVIQPDPVAFPHGMKEVADFVHSKGLLFGIYTDRGEHTCVGRPGSQGYEELDASTYAEWGVDYVKEDSCNATGDHNASFAQYGLMRDALNKTGRRIYFDLCGWSSWYAPVGKTLGNAWRVGYDVNNWGGVMNNALAVDKDLAQFAGPGGWNDIDALIGSNPKTAVHLTQPQSRTQFNLWALLSAQLIIGGSILELNPWDLETYTNTDVIAVNQDPAGVQAKLVMQYSQQSPNPYDPSVQQIWLKGPMHNGDYAIAFVNTTNTSAAYVEELKAMRDEGDGDVTLAECDSRAPAQLWNITSQPATPGVVRVESTTRSDGSKLTPPHCLEIRGCDYSVGAHVDTSYGCKALPPPGSTDGCAANMAWKMVDGALKAEFDLSLCLDIIGGGTLASCDGSRTQQWTIQPVGTTGSLVQLVSGSGFGCLSNGPPSGGAPATLSFDMNGLGWKAATITDLWSKQVTTGASVSASLPAANGISQVFRLAKLS